MNLLAHLHVGDGLSAVEAAGNLAADYDSSLSPEAYARGVHFHRSIDAFTDSHALVADARALFSGSYRRFGGVLSDLAFDYCLSRTWSDWAPSITRAQFIDLGESASIADLAVYLAECHLTADRGGDAMVVRPGIKTGVPLHYDHPEEIGADRIVNAIAAYAVTKGPAVVVEF